MKSGIYCIKNIITQKIYVGKAEDIYSRWEQHKSGFKNGNHPNKEMLKDCVDYGVKSFEFKILEQIDNTQDNFTEILAIKERQWGDKLNARGIDVGYNIAEFYCGDLTQEEIEERNKRPGQKPHIVFQNNQEKNDEIKINKSFLEGVTPSSNFLRIDICTNLGSSCYVTYLTLVSAKNENGRTQITMKEIADMTGFVTKSIKRNINKLYENGYIIIDSSSSTNKYWFPKEKFFDEKDEEMLNAKKRTKVKSDRRLKAEKELDEAKAREAIKDRKIAELERKLAQKEGKDFKVYDVNLEDDPF